MKKKEAMITIIFFLVLLFGLDDLESFDSRSRVFL